MSYPHLIECTMADYDRRTYIIGIGYGFNDLTDEEKQVVMGSHQYMASHEIKELKNLLANAYKDFEKLHGMNLPEKAMQIVNRWIDEDEDE